jgi:hypothetical protein
MGMCVFPSVVDNDTFVMNSDYVELLPGNEITIPLEVQYNLPESSSLINSTGKTDITKTVTFDLRTSLYRDPITYKIEINASYWPTVPTKYNDNYTYVGTTISGGTLRTGNTSSGGTRRNTYHSSI